MQKDEILLKKAPKLNQNDSGRLVMASPLYGKSSRFWHC